jgi:hypothetical protein
MQVSQRFDLPRLGAGLGFRPALANDIEQHRSEIPWVELCSDHYIGRAVTDRTDRAVRLAGLLPVVPHGLDLSIGTDAPLDMDYCEQLVHLVKTVKAPWYSDHLCFTKASGLELGQLTPIAFTRRAAKRCAEKARQFQDMLGVPLLLENITYYFDVPGEISEAEFLSQVVTEGDCGILLDLTNLYINSQNLGYDPYAFMDAIPLDRVVQVHIAGGVLDGDLWIDTHSHPVDNHPPVWDLLEHLCRRAPVRAVLLERDSNLPDDFGEILAEIEHVKQIMA